MGWAILLPSRSLCAMKSEIKAFATAIRGKSSPLNDAQPRCDMCRLLRLPRSPYCLVRGIGAHADRRFPGAISEAGRKSRPSPWRTAQHVQPLGSSNTPSTAVSSGRWSSATVSNSLMMTAVSLRSATASTLQRNVVLPLPRKPVSTERGDRLRGYLGEAVDVTVHGRVSRS